MIIKLWMHTLDIVYEKKRRRNYDQFVLFANKVEHIIGEENGESIRSVKETKIVQLLSKVTRFWKTFKPECYGHFDCLFSLTGKLTPKFFRNQKLFEMLRIHNCIHYCSHLMLYFNTVQ